jgi:receptor protein-tyrosine kinase
MPLLEKPTLSKTLAAAQAGFEWVIIDAPPINPFADAHCLASVADGVLLVARWNFTPREELDRALNALKGTTLFGLAVNAYDEPRQSYYYSHYLRPESNPESSR